MPHVFVSYVRDNSDIVDRLANELRSRGVTVWLDREDIEAGARWRDAIKNAIRDGRFFLACFSKELNERDRSYMNEELTIAVEELRARPSDRTWFIPLLINNTKIPSRSISQAEDLSHIQAVNLHEDWNAGIQRILRVIKHDDPVAARVFYLIDILGRPFKIERLFAIRELQAIGPAAADAVGALVTALKDQDSDVRVTAVDALQAIGPAAASAVPALLLTNLKDDNADARHRAFYALRAIDADGNNSVLALATALTDPDADFRRRVFKDAFHTLRGIGPAALPALAAGLKDPNAFVRRGAAGGFRHVAGTAVAAAVPALVAALKDQDAGVRRHAAEALYQLGSGPMADAEFIEFIATLDQDLSVRRRATEALRSLIAAALQTIGPAAAEAVPALIAALKDQDAGVRRHAAKALLRFGKAQAIVPALIAALDDQDENVRRHAVEALHTIGPDAVEAVPALAKALTDQNISVRSYAFEALALINQKDADLTTLRDIIRKLSRTIGRLRNWSFNRTSFPVAWFDPFTEFLKECVGPKFEFDDTELETSRKALIDGLNSLERLISIAEPVPDQSGRYQIPIEWLSARPAHYEEMAKRFDVTTSRICTTYDTLIQIARRNITGN